MSKGNNEIVTFLLGTAIGVGAGLYLNSKNGKKMRKEALHKISDIEQTIEDKVNKAYDDLKEQVNTTANKVKEATKA